MAVNMMPLGKGDPGRGETFSPQQQALSHKLCAMLREKQTFTRPVLGGVSFERCLRPDCNNRHGSGPKHAIAERLLDMLHGAQTGNRVSFDFALARLCILASCYAHRYLIGTSGGPRVWIEGGGAWKAAVEVLRSQEGQSPSMLGQNGGSKKQKRGHIGEEEEKVPEGRAAKKPAISGAVSKFSKCVADHVTPELTSSWSAATPDFYPSPPEVLPNPPTASSLVEQDSDVLNCMHCEGATTWINDWGWCLQCLPAVCNSTTPWCTRCGERQWVNVAGWCHACYSAIEATVKHLNAPSVTDPQGMGKCASCQQSGGSSCGCIDCWLKSVDTWSSENGGEQLEAASG